MKKLLIGLLALGSITSFASVSDVGVIGPQGEVLIYYKQGDFIIVKTCEPNTVLGMNPTEARTNCEGKYNKVPVEYFKQAIKNMVSTDKLNVLKPLTPEEIDAYLKGGPSSEKINAMTLELDKINKFIAAYGADNANLVRKGELVRALRSQETRLSAIKKIDAEVDKAVNLIVDHSKVTLTKFDQNKDQFLYTVLKRFNPNLNSPCGLKGSLEERVKDCSYQSTHRKGGFVLVMRTKDFQEIRKDTKTGLLWSERYSHRMTHLAAEIVCNTGLKDKTKIPGVSWRLPKLSEFEKAYKNGIRKALPNMNNWFWSSSVTESADYKFIYSGFDADTYDAHKLYDRYSVQCVGRRY